jgi:hypothetical protein
VSNAWVSCRKAEGEHVHADHDFERDPDPPTRGIQTQQATLVAHADNTTPAGTDQIEVFGNAAETGGGTTVLVVFQD